MSKSLIVDISHHQPSNKIDWARAAKEVAFFIIRVQYGSSTIDRECENHVANCKKYEIPFGHYAYGRFVSVEDAKVEAKDFLNRIDKEAKFLALDTEEDTIKSCGTKDVADASQAFIEVCRKAGHKTGFYVSHHLYKKYDLDKVQGDFLWIPRYGVNDGTANKKPDYACCLWQYTEKGKVPWYPSYLDFNKLHGSKILEWFIGSAKTMEAPKTQVKSKVIVNIKGGKNVVKKGERGQIVKTIQLISGAKVDGIFGPNTESKVKSFQKSKGLSKDGIVGPKTWEAMTGDKGGLLH